MPHIYQRFGGVSVREVFRVFVSFQCLHNLLVIRRFFCIVLDIIDKLIVADNVAFYTVAIRRLYRVSAKCICHYIAFSIHPHELEVECHEFFLHAYEVRLAQNCRAVNLLFFDGISYFYPIYYLSHGKHPSISYFT